MINFELFHAVASRCGYQFSALCDGEYFQYTETKLLWDLLSYDAVYAIDEYLSYERLLNYIDMYYDMEATNIVYHSCTGFGFDELEYERVRLEIAEKLYKEFVELYCK